MGAQAGPFGCLCPGPDGLGCGTRFAQTVLAHTSASGPGRSYAPQALPPHVHPLLGDKIRVRLARVDAPEVRTKCEAEKVAGYEARDAHVERLLEGKSIYRNSGIVEGSPTRMKKRANA